MDVPPSPHVAMAANGRLHPEVRMKTHLPPVVAFCLVAFVAGGADWPQWRGPGRTDVSAETGLLKTWPADGPPLLWTFGEAGTGYSGPAVVGDRVYILGARGGTEQVFALDLKTGKEVWSADIGPTFTFKGNTWGEGPRSTPSVDGDLLYALGGQGELVCVETASGKERWRKNMLKDLEGAMSPAAGAWWGYSWSPLVDGVAVICVPGGAKGTLAAVDKKTGDVLWRSAELTDPSTYSSPIVEEVDGSRQYMQMTDFGVAGVAAKDGKLLWNYRRKPPYEDVIITTPVYHDHHVYTTAGFGQGCDLVKITAADGAFNAAKAYANKNMKNTQGGVVLVNEYIYGYSDGRGWVCQDFKTGKVVWDKKKLGAGSLTCADGHLYCYAENEGTAALVEVSKTGYQEKGRFEIPQKAKNRAANGKIWTHPVVANGRLYLRDQEWIFCYDIKDRSAGGR
jgi:outer membrane protein assembly factor BamB